MFKTLYQGSQNHMNDCLEKNLFSGKRVLEVGGNIPKEITEKLEVKSWDCVDPVFKETVQYGENYRHIKASILDYEPDDSYDFVIATNSFEHIHGLKDGIDNIYRIMKKGAILSSLLGPIWSSYKGHHVWAKENENLITFDELKMPDWAHLLYSKEELIQMLNKNYTPALSQKIAKQMTDWKFLNKLFYDDYLQIINNSRFKKIEFRDWHTSKFPTAEIQKKLEERHGGKNFSTVSIKMILEKRE